MAVTKLVSFEGGSADVDGVTLTGTNSYDITTFRTGARALRCNPASGASGYADIGVSGTVWVHFGLYVATLPSVTRDIAGIAVKLRSDGKLDYHNSAGTFIGTSTTALTTGQWYWIGAARGTVSSQDLLQIDGASEVTGSISASNWLTRLGPNATEASSIDLYIDDVVVDDAGFLAASKVDILRPISDNSNTNWRCGDSSTTNLFEAANNVPPSGVASASETATSNIESASNTGTATYIANLTTYATAGVASGDTVLAVQEVLSHGEDIATGTKTGSVELTGNPVITAAGFTFGSDAGAHGAHVGGLWTAAFGAMTTSPSVTLGSSPTMKLVKTDTTTRVGCIDFMGLLVAWTPVAAAPDRVPYATPYPQLLPH